MKDLIQLINLTSRKRVGKINILQNPVALHSKQSQLYNIISGEYETDEAAIIQKLYGDNLGNTSNKFVKLKSRLRQKLLNTIFFIEPNDHIIKQKTNAIRQVYFGKTILSLGSYPLAIKMFKKSVAIAEKIELFDIAYDATFQLISIASKNANTTEFNMLNSDLDRYEKLRNIQANLTKKIYQINIELKRNKPNILKCLYLIDEGLSNIQSDRSLKKFQSILEIGYKLNILKFKLNNQPKGVLKTCNKAIQSTLNHPLLSSNSYLHFKHEALSAYYHLNQFKQGQLFIQNLPKSRKFRAIGVQLETEKKYEVLFKLGELQFHDAYQETISFMKTKCYKNLGESIQESWKLFNVYAEWGLKNHTNSKGIISIARYENNKQNKFRIYKFLNEVLQITKEKQGYNIALNIFQLLHFLSIHDQESFSQKVEAIRAYKNRYLKDEKYSRARIFINMLLSIERYSFDAEKINLNNAKNHEELMKYNQMDLVGIYELIPFQKLWKISLNILNRKHQMAKAI